MRRPVIALCALSMFAVLPGGLALAEPASSSMTSAASSVQDQDIVSRLKSIPGVTSVEESTSLVPEGRRFFLIDFEQRVDHRDPSKGTFTQRLSLLHRDVDRPMVMDTEGYFREQWPVTVEPALIVDGNQISVEHRFFEPSKPADPDWESQLTIWQAATDHHRVLQAFQAIYDQKWLTTGVSKGGMAATYHRHFYPDDVAGTIAYVAPNDVRDKHDAHPEFLEQVGTPECRSDLKSIQRRLLGPERSWFMDQYAQKDAEAGNTYETVGGRGAAYELSVVNAYWEFWQENSVAHCKYVPSPTAPKDVIWKWFTHLADPMSNADGSYRAARPYYFQAAYQTGSPTPLTAHLEDLREYPDVGTSLGFLPEDLRPARFDKKAMREVDTWMRTDSSQVLHINGESDPWAAEPFTCGPQGGTRECHRFVAPDRGHGARIKHLPDVEKKKATNLILTWAGLDDQDPAAQHLRTHGTPKERGLKDDRGQKQSLIP